jgi:predicted nucleotidyltransferase
MTSIHNNIQNVDKLKQIVYSQPYPLLFATISGAHLYGFPSADSDYDLRGVHILPFSEVVGLNTGPETLDISEDRDGLELDLVTHEVKKFFGLLLKKNGYVLEQLYSPLVVETTPDHDELKEIAKNCITRHHCHHYFGFADTQWKLINKEETIRVKPLLYLFRVVLTGIHLMKTGEIEANLATLNENYKLPYIPDLIARKVNGREKAVLDNEDISFYENEYQRLLIILENAANESKLPDIPSAKPALHDLLVRIRRKYSDWTGACPVCGLNDCFEKEYGSYSICPRCNWEDDSVQWKKPDYQGGANRMSLQQARRAWNSCKNLR